MILPDFVDQALEEISETLSYNDNRDLDKAIEAWCNKLEFEHNETKEIKKIVQELVKPQINNYDNDGIINFYNNVILFVGIPDNFLQAMKNLNPKNFLFAILTMVVFAFILNRLKPSKQDDSKRLKTKNDNALSPQIEANEYSQILVLVINVSSIDKLECFQSSSKIMPSEAEELYRSTRALWIGTKSEYLHSPLQNIFDEKNLSTQEEQSNVDVYFIKLELKENHPGFKPNANPMDKLDAFKMLHKIANKVNISSRLPSKYYQNTGVYLL